MPRSFASVLRRVAADGPAVARSRRRPRGRPIVPPPQGWTPPSVATSITSRSAVRSSRSPGPALWRARRPAGPSWRAWDDSGSSTIPTTADHLPIGMTATAAKSGTSGARMLGINCAACHVGEMTHGGRTYRIDGAPNVLMDIIAFNTRPDPVGGSHRGQSGRVRGVPAPGRRLARGGGPAQGDCGPTSSRCSRPWPPGTRRTAPTRWPTPWRRR